MKRALAMEDDVPVTGEDLKMKKVKVEEEREEEEEEREEGFMLLDENLLYEVLKHADAKTLATAACVSKQWHKTAQDERLWELICTRHGANLGCGNQQLRSVVLALGGFRRLHSLYPWPISSNKPSSSSASASASASASSSGWPSSSSLSNPLPPMMAAKPPTRWGKDEVHLSLSLLSIRYYEKMNFTRR